MNNVIFCFVHPFEFNVSLPLYYLVNITINDYKNLPTSYNVFCHKFLCFLVPLRICLKHNNLLLCLTETEKENLVLVHTWTKNSTCWDPLRNPQLSSIALPFLWHKWVHRQCWPLPTCLKRLWKKHQNQSPPIRCSQELNSLLEYFGWVKRSRGFVELINCNVNALSILQNSYLHNI